MPDWPTIQQTDQPLTDPRTDIRVRKEVKQWGFNSRLKCFRAHILFENQATLIKEVIKEEYQFKCEV